MPLQVHLDEMATIDPNEFLYAGNQLYITEMYERFCDDPGSVDISWQSFFDSLSNENKKKHEHNKGASWSPSDATVFGQIDHTSLSETMEQGTTYKTGDTTEQTNNRQQASKLRKSTLDTIRALMLIRSWSL